MQIGVTDPGVFPATLNSVEHAVSQDKGVASSGSSSGRPLTGQMSEVRAFRPLALRYFLNMLV